MTEKIPEPVYLSIDASEKLARARAEIKRLTWLAHEQRSDLEETERQREKLTFHEKELTVKWISALAADEKAGEEYGALHVAAGHVLKNGRWMKRTEDVCYVPA